MYVAFRNLFLGCLTVLLAGSFTTGVRASPALVFDPATGLVLHSEEPDRKWYPASLTKLMTAYVTFEALRDKRISDATLLPVTELANTQEPTRLWLRVETQLPLKMVLGATVVKSANDAAAMLADGVGGTLAEFTRYGACRVPGVISKAGAAASTISHPMEMFHRQRDGFGAARFDDATGLWERCRYDAFVVRMNATAKRLGMTRTVFANPNGLPDKRQFTTARDMARLAHAIIRDFPEQADLFAKKKVRFRGGRLRSYNALLRTFKGADGMKTGFTCASGFNIVASATRENRRIIAVVLGWASAKTRNTRTEILLDNGFGITPANIAVKSEYFATLPVTDDLTLPPLDIRDQLRTRSCRRRIRHRRKVKAAVRRPSIVRKRKVSRKRKAVRVSHAKRPRAKRKVRVSARRKTRLKAKSRNAGLRQPVWARSGQE